MSSDQQTTAGDDRMTHTNDVEQVDHGTLEQTGDRPVLRFMRRLAHPRERVWRTLTQEDHLAAWFPTTIEGALAPGASLRFSHTDQVVPPFDGEMLAFEPPALMELRWGDDVLRFELEPDGPDGCVLVFTATFDELGKAARDGAGWHACLDLLACEADGRKAPWSSADRWRQVHEGYKQRFGSQAATIGPPEAWESTYGSASARPD
jgi:uncharacterized protein YndB with AHSA1/START domain